MLKIAVASNDGSTVDEHFGRAKAFCIYEVEDDGTSRLVEHREIKPGAEAAHGSDAAVEQLSDVNAVLVAQIGPNAQGALTRRGIRSFALGGPVDKALASYGKRHKLLDVTIPGIPKGYSPEKRCGSGSGCSTKGGCK
jgi:nitrogen fixation protein NifB